MGEFGGMGGRLGLRHFFCDGQKRDYLSRSSQRARGATKKGKTSAKDIALLADMPSGLNKENIIDQILGLAFCLNRALFRK